MGPGAVRRPRVASQLYCPAHRAARSALPRVLQIVHGYPPREVAGTEVATRRLVEGLRRRGWDCHVLAATRAPGHPHGSILSVPGERGITRVVNNLPHRPLEDLERDLAIEACVARLMARERPDVVHVQHLAFLSSGLRFDVPAVGTLHDHWPWCPAGGTMLRPGGQPCPQPEPEACARCYSAWARLPGRVEHAAVRASERLARWIPPDRLHALWRSLPLAVRARLRGPVAPAGSAAAVAARRGALAAAWNALDARMAPSAFLADEARRRGLGEVRVVPAGLDPTGPFRGGGPVVYLGSLLPHKGAHIVAEGYRAAFGDGGPGLEIFGDPGLDPAYAQELGGALRGFLAPAAVADTLAGATALALGSIWPENAPLVILEARAAGCPVIAPRIGGIPELVEDGRDGFLYEPGEPAALAEALRRLCTPGVQASLAVRPPPSLEEHAVAVEAVYRAASAARRAGAAPWNRGGRT